MKPKAILDILKDTLSEWGRHKASMMAAALSYYTVFSLAPLVIIVITVVGLLVGKSAAQDQIMTQIKSLVGDSGASMVQTMVDNANKPADGILATIIGFVTLGAGAAGVFTQLKGALNTIWDVVPKEEGGIKGILASIRSQFLSFGMVLGIGFLLLVSLVLSAGLSAASQLISGVVPMTTGVLELVNTVLSFGVITLMFAALYKFLPDEKIDWRDVLIGAAFTSLLFTIGKFAIGLYLGHSGTASAYGAAGSLVVILLWVFYSSQILFFGAEFTHVYAYRRAGKPIGEKSPEAIAQKAGQTAKAAASNVKKTADKTTSKPEVQPAKPTVRQDRVVTTADRLHSVGQVALILMNIFAVVQRLRGVDNRKRRQQNNRA